VVPGKGESASCLFANGRPQSWLPLLRQKNTGQNGGRPKLDLNVAAAWAQGVTGKNITTAIMDDGVDYMHPDLINNYNARASYDFSSNDPYPFPRYTDDWFNRWVTEYALAKKMDEHIMRRYANA